MSGSLAGAPDEDPAATPAAEEIMPPALNNGDTALPVAAARCEASDLELIDHAGALRMAAEALLAETSDAALSADERAVSQAALMRLFTYCEKIDA